MLNFRTGPMARTAGLAGEWIRSGVTWSPSSPAYISNPYPVYRKLRERSPVHWSALSNQYLVSCYEDVNRVLKDHKRFSKDFSKGDLLKRGKFAQSRVSKNMLTMDPPDHTRLRDLVSQAFTPRVVEQLEDYIRSTVRQLLRRVEGAREFDIMKVLANPLPTIVIAKMIGVPEKDVEQFKAWSNQYVRVVEPALSEPEVNSVLEASKRFGEYFGKIIEQRRHEPRDDLVSLLIDAHDEGEKLTSNEMTATLRLLLVAGNETTTNLIGNGLRALLLHRDQMELLREQPDLTESAIEEFLRFDSPIQIDSRFTATDVEINGRTLKPDCRIACLLGSANRDPDRFDQPDTLDITRPKPANLAFGRGIHYCLGAPLARLEGKIALEVLMESFTDIRFGDRKPVYCRSTVLRGLQHLDIIVERRRTPRAKHRAAADDT